MMPEEDGDIASWFCPNCGRRYVDFKSGDLDGAGCGDCAQAGVRPRDLYLLRPLAEWTRQEDYRFRYECPNCHGIDGLHSGMDVCPPNPSWVTARNGGRDQGCNCTQYRPDLHGHHPRCRLTHNGGPT